MPAIEAAGFVRKPGGTFLWGAQPRAVELLLPRRSRRPAARVPRRARAVRSHPAEARRRARRRTCARRTASRRSSTTAAEPGGRRSTSTAHASRRRRRGSSTRAASRRCSAGATSSREFNPFFKNLAVFGYFAGRGAARAAQVEGNILSAAFADGWFWFIPLHDGTTSVGAVVDATRFAGEAAADADAAVRAPDRRLPAGARRGSPARRRVSPVRVIRDYSYCSAPLPRPRLPARRRRGLLHRSGLLHRRAPRLHGRAISPRARSSRCSVAAGAGGRRAGRVRSPLSRRLRALPALPLLLLRPPRDPDSYFWTARKILNPEGRSRRAPRSCG